MPSELWRLKLYAMSGYYKTSEIKAAGADTNYLLGAPGDLVGIFCFKIVDFVRYLQGYYFVI